MKMLALTAALAAATVASGALAQSAAYDPYPSDPAQLQREHNRAMAAGDSANDPFNSASSDALNRQQVQGTSLGYQGIMGNQYVAPDATVYDGQDTTGQMPSNGTVGDQYVSPNTCITPPQAVAPGAPPPVCDQPMTSTASPPQSNAEVW